ncbi:hypothetical protein ILUMI_08579 [Ignelater luminosus]|uniref:Uncharacterized protein n=1 Tax=Ignelater luminosus TaxID=2038154 RepID=A0A8K0D1E0_IGNLU|nr:hypothetical protein ILUMI_08579 [Ignelater luminosus]
MMSDCKWSGVVGNNCVVSDWDGGSMYYGSGMYDGSSVYNRSYNGGTVYDGTAVVTDGSGYATDDGAVDHGSGSQKVSWGWSGSSKGQESRQHHQLEHFEEVFK